MATASNPVIPGCHPDPSICRVGDDYYLVCSSFEYFPGVPIFHSTDLVSWQQIGNVLERHEQLRLESAPASLGTFAPTLRYHNGQFWMITTNLFDRGNFWVTAEDPAGPWSDPVLVEIAGIDPDLAWDNHGSCWITYSGIGQIRVDDSTGVVLEGPTPQWSGTGLQYPEAPHLYEIDGTWYLLIAEGGTERGHAVSIARGPSPSGPWEGCPANPILSHRSTDLPIQNIGHADLVQAVDSSWWLVCLGTRPRGMTPSWHVLGRETFLAPVEWRHGWPVVAQISDSVTGPDVDGASITQPRPWTGRDNFDEPALDPAWISVRRRRDEDWSLDERPGWLVLHGSAEGMDGTLPVFVGRRQDALTVKFVTSVTTGGFGNTAANEAGLCLRMDERHHVEVTLVDGEIVARAQAGDLTTELGRARTASDTARLSIEAAAGSDTSGPDELRLSYRDADGEAELGRLDGRYLSTEVAGGFTGRVCGIYAVGGSAAFDWFDAEIPEAH